MKDSEHYEGSYEGWSNFETWNVALWINNTYEFYKIAQHAENYKDFLEKAMTDGRNTTPDGVCWDSKWINHDELNETLFSEK